jgi:hypothetical protein
VGLEKDYRTLIVVKVPCSIVLVSGEIAPAAELLTQAHHRTVTSEILSCK